MPCRSDYQEPNAKEVESRTVAKLLVYLLSAIDKDVPDDVQYAAKSEYGNTQHLDGHTALLCSTIQGLSKRNQDKLIYDGRNAAARKLADWWENHQQVDAQRIAEEKKQKRNAKLVESALAKLTPAERKALGHK